MKQVKGYSKHTSYSKTQKKNPEHTNLKVTELSSNEYYWMKYEAAGETRNLLADWIQD